MKNEFNASQMSWGIFNFCGNWFWANFTWVFDWYVYCRHETILVFRISSKLYANHQLNYALENLKLAKNVRKKAFLFLFFLFMVDILPIPVTPVIAVIIILSRPVWFYTLVINIYKKGS